MYNYTITKSDKYEVLLKDNDFYTNKVLPSGLYYPGRGVDDYVLTFEYNFKANEKKSLEYNYTITAEMVGTADSGDGKEREVWNRLFNILETKTGTIENDSFSINEKVNIDYDYFNNLARYYEENYELNIDSILKVRLNVNLPELKMEDFIELDIDLTNEVTSLEENYQAVTTNIISNSNEKDSQNPIWVITVSIFLVLFAIVWGIFKAKQLKNPKEKYRNNVKKALKYCDDFLVQVKDKPNIEGLKLMKISDLDDLVKIAEQTKTNIIYYETVKDKISNLYLILNDYCYIYDII